MAITNHSELINPYLFKGESLPVGQVLRAGIWERGEYPGVWLLPLEGNLS